MKAEHWLLVVIAALILAVLALYIHTRTVKSVQERYAEGYAYGLTMCDHPADRSEAEGHVQNSRDFGEYTDFDRGVEDALNQYPHGLPRRP